MESLQFHFRALTNKTAGFIRNFFFLLLLIAFPLLSWTTSSEKNPIVFHTPTHIHSRGNKRRMGKIFM